MGAMRTKEIAGVCSGPPEVGFPFIIHNDAPLVEEDNTGRIVTTSPVVWTQTQFEGGIAFQTASGTDYIFEEINAHS